MHRSQGMLGIRRYSCVAAALVAASSIVYAQTPAAGRAFTETYCQACHDNAGMVAGVSFESIDWNNPGKSAAVHPPVENDHAIARGIS